MKTIYKAAALAALTIPASVAMVSTASAQSNAGVFDTERAVATSKAYTDAMKLIATTYKPNIDQANAKATEINTRLKPMQDALVAASKVPNANAATLRTQQEAYQKAAQAGQQEVDKLREPIDLATAYVGEQIMDKLEPALDKVMAAKKVAIVLVPQATVKAAPASDLTPDVVTELNASVPSVGVVPPQGWLPAQVRAQIAEQQRRQGAQAAPAPAKPAGR
ncbi:OmpH family outer membrane protein [Sphingobium boeckii]|uniref:Skp family chaperone for outer membrane proteins n=1 Tax=Sphingobium boeckii TaxID=1082345 RepID=A0A7W9EH28_9SPHN|nr:OmpH family outer membrane protein [Sphingobium boeckii]MBB5687321.1 Skp family chaperone for outer membrane proteins [Sphingobium boeckii]